MEFVIVIADSIASWLIQGRPLDRLQQFSNIICFERSSDILHYHSFPAFIFLRVAILRLKLGNIF